MTKQGFFTFLFVLEVYARPGPHVCAHVVGGSRCLSAAIICVRLRRILCDYWWASNAGPSGVHVCIDNLEGEPLSWTSQNPYSRPTSGSFGPEISFGSHSEPRGSWTRYFTMPCVPFSRSSKCPPVRALLGRLPGVLYLADRKSSSGLMNKWDVVATIYLTRSLNSSK